MVCIHCSSETNVINSRHQKRSNQVWRRRRCTSCKSVFTTLEGAEYALAWQVRSATGHLEPFSRDKLFLSIWNSLQHRKSALADAGALTDTVLKKLLHDVKDATLSPTHISRSAFVALNRFDKVAATHYQAFHPVT
jgi:transcriptional regulator NrdR family protein